MQTYETLFITSPELAEDQERSAVETLAKIVTDGGGSMVANERMGRRRLAYPIRKIQEGYYYFIHGQFSASVLPELERTIKLNEDILRHMVIRTDA